jgi:acyl-[acyl-carrier-protein]-phospholipid O-acyltransferase/long-chain-fatty-acid--[acyl-carrier-protein] ligase
VIHALHRAGDAIRNGGIVCVFAAGQITRTGELNKFQRGFERIMKNVDSPVVPVALGELLVLSAVKN